MRELEKRLIAIIFLSILIVFLVGRPGKVSFKLPSGQMPEVFVTTPVANQGYFELALADNKQIYNNGEDVNLNLVLTTHGEPVDVITAVIGGPLSGSKWDTSKLRYDKIINRTSFNIASNYSNATESQRRLILFDTTGVGLTLTQPRVIATIVFKAQVDKPATSLKLVPSGGIAESNLFIHFKGRPDAENGYLPDGAAVDKKLVYLFSCQPSTFQCCDNNAGRQICGRTGIWGSCANCSAGYGCGIYNGNAICYSQCKPGTLQCTAGGVKQTCSQEGKWTNTPCTLPKPYCTDQGTCVVCLNGQKRCSGSTGQICSGNNWPAGDTSVCTPGKVCLLSLCRPDYCQYNYVTAGEKLDIADIQYLLSHWGGTTSISALMAIISHWNSSCVGTAP